MVVNCCVKTKTNAKTCIRKKDGRIFLLPRKFSRKQCMKKIKGFTMRSSCAPYRDCKKTRKNRKQQRKSKKPLK